MGLGEITDPVFGISESDGSSVIQFRVSCTCGFEFQGLDYFDKSLKINAVCPECKRRYERPYNIEVQFRGRTEKTE